MPLELAQIGTAANTYAADNQGYTVPAGYLTNPTGGDGGLAENYATILVTGKYLPAPPVSSPNAPPHSEVSVFRCPDGITDIVGINYSPLPAATKPDPGTRTDALGWRPWRQTSTGTGVTIDTWYGIDADWGSITLQGYHVPSHILPDQTAAKDGGQSWGILAKYSSLRDAATLVMLYDGIFYDLTYNPNRMTARHGKKNKTNLLFMDGHAETADTASLPGGIGDARLPSNPFVGTTPSAVLSAARTGSAPTSREPARPWAGSAVGGLGRGFVAVAKKRPGRLGGRARIRVDPPSKRYALGMPFGTPRDAVTWPPSSPCVDLGPCQSPCSGCWHPARRSPGRRPSSPQISRSCLRS